MIVSKRRPCSVHDCVQTPSAKVLRNKWGGVHDCALCMHIVHAQDSMSADFRWLCSFLSMRADLTWVGCAAFCPYGGAAGQAGNHCRHKEDNRRYRSHHGRTQGQPGDPCCHAFAFWSFLFSALVIFKQHTDISKTGFPSRSCLCSLEQPTQPLKSQRKRYNLYEPGLLLCSCLLLMCNLHCANMRVFVNSAISFYKERDLTMRTLKDRGHGRQGHGSPHSSRRPLRLGKHWQHMLHEFHCTGNLPCDSTEKSVCGLCVASDHAKLNR